MISPIEFSRSFNRPTRTRVPFHIRVRRRRRRRRRLLVVSFEGPLSRSSTAVPSTSHLIAALNS